MKTMKDEVVSIKELFIPVDVKSLDGKNRISLGGRIRKALLKKMRVDTFKIFIGSDGDVLLRPMANVPSKEAWLYENKKAMSQVNAGLSEAKRGKVEKVIELEDFLREL